MKIEFKRNKEQIELVKAMAHRDVSEAVKAQEAMAAFMSPLLSKVIDTATGISSVFTKSTYDMDDSPSLPVDLFSDITDEEYIKVYSQAVAGGLPSALVTPSASEMKIATYHLDSAVSFDKKYAAKSRLDVVAKAFARLGQEVMLKQDRTSASLVLGTLADNVATNLVAGGSTTLQIADFNKLIYTAKRVNASWNKGTPANRAGGVTDLWMGPERMADLRAMAYNPINTVAVNNIAAINSSPAITAPDEIRRKLFEGGGLSEFYGFAIHEINELGKAQRYSKIFNAAYNTFSATADDLILALDLSGEGLVRAVAADPESNNEINLQVDNQFSNRQRKIGFWMDLEEGRVVLDRRVIFGIRIASAAT